MSGPPSDSGDADSQTETQRPHEPAPKPAPLGNKPISVGFARAFHSGDDDRAPLSALLLGEIDPATPVKSTEKTPTGPTDSDVLSMDQVLNRPTDPASSSSDASAIANAEGYFAEVLSYSMQAPLDSARANTVSPSARLADIRAHFDRGDYSTALALVEDLLATEPGQAGAQAYADQCRQKLLALYTEKLGNVSRRPRMRVPLSDIRDRQIDHRAGFLLSCMSSALTVDELLDVAGMPKLDTLRILYELLQAHIIELDDA